MKTIQNIKPELLKSFDTLYNHAVQITAKWHCVKSLFYNTQERRNVLKQTGNLVFLLTHDSLVNDVFISIARLIDQKKGTLSLHRLHSDLGKQAPPALAMKLKPLVLKAAHDCKSIIQHRHSILAHLNWNAIHNPFLNVLPNVGLKDVDVALVSIQTVFETFSKEVLNKECLFNPMPAIGGPDTLVQHLERALRAFEEDFKQRVK